MDMVDIEFTDKRPDSIGIYLVKFKVCGMSDIMLVFISEMEVDEDDDQTKNVFIVDFPSYFNFIECRTLDEFYKDFKKNTVLLWAKLPNSIMPEYFKEGNIK